MYPEENKKIGGAQVYGSGVTQTGLPQNQPIGGAVTSGGFISQDGTTPITAASLTDTQPFNLAPKANLTGAVGVGEQVLTYANEAKTSVDSKLAAEQAQLSQESSLISSLMEEEGNAGTKKLNAYQDSGLLKQKEQVDSIAADMEAENRKAELKIQEIMQKNPNGVLDTSGEIYRIKQANAFYQANKGIELAVLGGQYDRAKALIDTKVDLETEQIRAKIEARKFTYGENKERFTKEEQRKIEADLRKEEREYDEYKLRRQSEEARKLKQMEIEQKAKEYRYQELPDGRAVMLDKDGNIVKEISSAPQTKEEKEALASQVEQEKTIPALKDKVAQIDTLIKATESGTGAVGPNAFARSSPLNAFNSNKDNFIASVEQLVSTETLDTLINLKRSGGTLGALSDGERMMLQAAASKIGTWRILDENKNVVGYKTTEKAFKAELEQLKTLAQRAINNSIGVTEENPLGLDLPADPLGLGI